jgi:hypothetical protein
MPNSIYGFWSTLRTAFNEVNPFSQGSDLSAFDYLEERVRELEQEVSGLRRQLKDARSVPIIALEPHREMVPMLHQQPRQHWPRLANGFEADLSPSDAPSVSQHHLKFQQRAEYRGFIPIEAASPRYEVNNPHIAQRCSG